MIIDIFIFLPPVALLLYNLITRLLNYLFRNANTKSKENIGIDDKSFSKIYDIAEKIPIVGRSMSYLKDVLYITKLESKEILKKDTFIYYILSLLASVFTFSAILKFVSSELYIIILAFFVSFFYVRNLVIEKLIGNDTDFLMEFKEFIIDTNHFYKEHKMVTEAVEQGYTVSPDRLIKLHGKKIKEAIQSKNLFEEYSKNCPNRFLKLFINNAYSTKTLGDKTIKNESVFVKDNNYTIDEIKTEIRTRDQLQYRLKYLGVFCVVPCLFLNSIDKEAVKLFPQSAFFYNSGIGSFVKVVLLAISILSYIGIRNAQKYSKGETKVKLKSHYWEDDFLKIKLIRNLVDIFKPKEETAKYYEATELLVDTGSYMSIDFLYLRRVISGFILAVIMIFTVINVNNSDINAILNNTYYKFMDTSITSIVDGQAVDTSKYDAEIIRNSSNGDISDMEIVKELKEKGITNTADLEKSVTRIQSKIYEIRLDKYFIYFKCFLVFIGFSYFGSYIPIWDLKLKRKSRLFEMREEVFEFNSVLLMASNHKNSSIVTVLEWMYNFSDIFQKPLYKCINNLQKGEIKALNELKKDVQFRPFSRLIDNLIRIESIKLNDAFDSLEKDRENSKEDRKEENLRFVEEKSNEGRLLGFLPYYALVFGYLVVPMIIMAFLSLVQLLPSLTQF